MTSDERIDRIVGLNMCTTGNLVEAIMELEEEIDKLKQLGTKAAEGAYKAIKIRDKKLEVAVEALEKISQHDRYDGEWAAVAGLSFKGRSNFTIFDRS